MVVVLPALRSTLLTLAAATLLVPALQQNLDEILTRARQLRRAGQQSQALQLLESARGNSSDSSASADRDGLLGSLLLDLGQVGRARDLAAVLGSDDLDSYQALVFLGRFALEERHDPAQALAPLRRAAQLKAKPLEALQQLVALFVGEGQFGKAAKRAEAIAAFDQKIGRQLLGDVYLTQADQLRQGGAEMWPLAINRYQLALEQRPASLTIVRKLLDLQVLAIHLDDAAELSETAFAHDDQRGERLFWSGRIHEAAQEIEAARADYRESYALQPGAGTVCLHLARLALSQGRADIAREWLTRGQQIMGQSPRGLVLMAEVHNGLGDSEAALDCLDRAVSADPDNAGAMYQLARTLLRLGRRREGAAAMEQFRSLQQAARPSVDEP